MTENQNAPPGQGGALDGDGSQSCRAAISPNSNASPDDQHDCFDACVVLDEKRSLVERRRRSSQQMFEASSPIDGTLAEQFLDGCGLTGPWPSRTRYFPSVYCGNVRDRLPAIIAPIYAEFEESISALQCLWLKPDGAGPVFEGAFGYGYGVGAFLGAPGPTILLSSSILDCLAADKVLDGSPYVATGNLHMSRLPDGVERIRVIVRRQSLLECDRFCMNLARLEQRWRRRCKVDLELPPDGHATWVGAARAGARHE